MSIVAVAGGLGDLGRLIVEALIETGKHEVHVMSRKTALGYSTRTSPLTGKQYSPLIHTEYSSEEALIQQLAERQVNVIICTFIMDCESASEAQIRLIRAADKCAYVKRFIPSEFNVEYDVGDDILPYPEKRFHLASRRELERTSTFEYAYVYPGMFMDYFGMPKVKTSLRPLCFFVDPENGLAVLPDDGEARMSMTFTTDAARYIALALDLEKWPRVLTTVVSTVSLNKLIKLIEKSLGRKLQVLYQPLERLLKHDAIDLPTNLQIATEYPKRFPEGLNQLRGLIADLEAGVALGAYDLSKLDGHLDLAKVFQGAAVAPRKIEDLVEEAWSTAAPAR